MKRRNEDTGVVYSTEYGRMCPDCGKPKHRCICDSREKTQSASGPIRIRYETKGRKGKGVTIIEGLPTGSSDAIDFLQDIKRACGTGGTIKNGSILIQGDYRKYIKIELQKRGYID